VKPILISFAWAALAMAQPQPRYTVTDLDPEGVFSQATFVNSNGLATGIAVAPDGAQHAMLLYKGGRLDISKPGLGGPNSGAFGVNAWGQVLLQTETSAKDPNNENFCGYGTGLKCVPAVWQYGIITELPTLGGNNGTVGGINNRGEAVGVAETATRDPLCPPGIAPNGTGPQVLDFEAVIWGPRRGEVRRLNPLAGDSVGIAMSINDNGQVVGISGSCGNTQLPPFVAGPHAVLWDKDGSVHNLGNLGGTSNPALAGIGNIAFAINDDGRVSGASALKGNAAVDGFVWTKASGMKSIGTLRGDTNSAGLSIKNKGDVVGGSIAGDVATGSPRAFLWQNNKMHDLNDLVGGDSPLYLLMAFSINDDGQIAGFGVQKSEPHGVHAFLAAPKTRDDRNRN